MDELHELDKQCVRIHTHDCKKGGYRCLKRRDMEGNKICRTPPFPQSHSNYIMEIHSRYPQATLEVLHKLEMAKLLPGTKKHFVPCGLLTAEKAMYTAIMGEHILPTCVPLFCITRSSTNFLVTPSTRFSCSYLSRYTEKTEEHADGFLFPGADGKSFRLRSLTILPIVKRT